MLIYSLFDRMIGSSPPRRSSTAADRRGSATLSEENAHPVEFVDGPTTIKLANFAFASKDMLLILGESDVAFSTAKKVFLNVPYGKHT